MEIIIFGAGGHGASLANVAVSAGFSVQYFVDQKNFPNNQFMGIEVRRKIKRVHQAKLNVAIGIGDNWMRQSIYLGLRTQYNGLVFPSLIHSSAIISQNVKIGDGTVLMPNVVIGPNTKIGKFCILNTSSQLDHDGCIKSYSSLAPGVVIGGGVSIGTRTAICIGAIVKHAVVIGSDVIVGGNSYVNKNIASKKLVYGTPAMIIRSRGKSESYL
jgi:sugar O-acyltransferase (sialic acid O-acetyltransferase NeuD family)